MLLVRMELHVYTSVCTSTWPCCSADYLSVIFPSPHPSFHSCTATLTSYSEPVDRSVKHGEVTRASSLKLWHSQRATLDSGLYRLDENMAASTHSLNKIPEPSSSHHSSHPTPLYLMPRPNSVAGKSAPCHVPLIPGLCFLFSETWSSHEVLLYKRQILGVFVSFCL